MEIFTSTETIVQGVFNQGTQCNINMTAYTLKTNKENIVQLTRNKENRNKEESGEVGNHMQFDVG